MLGVVLDADSLGKGVDLSPVTELLDNWTVYPFTEPKQVAERIETADVVITMSWGKSMFGGKSTVKVPEVNKLKLLHTPGAGTDGINFDLLPSGCNVCNVYEHETTIAEYCLANILNWEIKLVEKALKFKNKTKK